MFIELISKKRIHWELNSYTQLKPFSGSSWYKLTTNTFKWMYFLIEVRQQNGKSNWEKKNWNKNEQTKKSYDATKHQHRCTSCKNILCDAYVAFPEWNFTGIADPVSIHMVDTVISIESSWIPYLMEATAVAVGSILIRETCIWDWIHATCMPCVHLKSMQFEFVIVFGS